MSDVGQIERKTQEHVARLLADSLCLSMGK